MDYKIINEQLKPYWIDILNETLPGGKIISNEYTCANLNGGHGMSFKFNINTGLWADFASNDSGADIISLYAATNNINQFESAKELQKKYLPSTLQDKPSWGNPTATYEYKNQNGDTLCYVCRYDSPKGKFFVPYHRSGNEWIKKMIQEPRPLYGLHKLPHKNILICEGEKSADAAQKIVGDKYACLSWSNGVKSIHKTNWSPVYSKNILIWPDADDPGINAAQNIAKILYGKCNPIKTLDVGTDKNGWDAADALADGWDWDKFKEWAVPIARVYQKQAEIKPSEPPEQRSTPEPSHTTIFNIGFDTGEESFSVSHYSLWEQLGLSINKQGGPDINNLNVLRVLNGMPKFKDMIWYDPFYGKIRTLISPPNHPPLKEPREWQDEDDSDLVTFFQGEIGFKKINETLVSKVVKQFARSNIKNEPKDWIESLNWDNVRRLDTFFTRCLGVEDSMYTHAVSRNFFLSIIARVFRPGCQLDSMVVLEGSQGLGKTSVLRTLGGKWHCEAQENVTSNNFFQVLQGKLIVEISELSSFPSSEINRIKQVISCPTDRYRTPYDRYPKDQPRSSIFCATTNEQHYLHDHTGARRFWPVRCGKINLDTAIRERDMLFAEAYKRFKDGEPWHLIPKDEASEIQEKRRQKDAWENEIKKYLFGKSQVENVEIFKDALGLNDIHRIDMKNQRRLNIIMSSLKWEYVGGVWKNSTPTDPEFFDGWS